ncbi:MAG: PAS domain S-box protein, partial [Bacteroidales bacterium]|nr:PAS domain S-box protein [Bacteroidales bacterium]
MKKEKTPFAREADFHLQLLNSLKESVIATDLSGKITFFNKYAEKLFRWPKSEVIGKDIIDIFPAGVPNNKISNKTKHIENRWEWEGELEARDKNGRAFPVQVSERLIIGKNDELIGVTIVSPNLSDKNTDEGNTQKRNDKIIAQNKKLEFQKEKLRLQKEEVKKTEELLNELNKVLQSEKQKSQHYLNIAGVMFIALDHKGNVTLANKKSYEILGYNQKDILGKNWFDNFLPKDSRTEIRNIYKALMKGDIENKEYCINRVVTKNGDERLIAWHNSLLLSQHGEVTGILSSGEDITETKNAEKALKESEEKYKAIVENNYDGIYIYQDDKFIFVNNKILELSGYSKDDVKDANIWNL